MEEEGREQSLKLSTKESSGDLESVGMQEKLHSDHGCANNFVWHPCIRILYEQRPVILERLKR